MNIALKITRVNDEGAQMTFLQILTIKTVGEHAEQQTEAQKYDVFK